MPARHGLVSDQATGPFRGGVAGVDIEECPAGRAGRPRLVVAARSAPCLPAPPLPAGVPPRGPAPQAPSLGPRGRIQSQ
jgi:hypothetical protein